MAHPAYFRTSLVSGYAADRPAAPAVDWKPLDAAGRLFRGFGSRFGSGYRPERHYMRGGRTPGAKSLGGR